VRKMMSILLMGLFLFMPMSYAQTQSDPGITPDSPFYFLDTAWETVRINLENNQTRRAELALEFADEKMAENERMIAENRSSALERSERRRARYMEQALNSTQNIENEQVREQVRNRLNSIQDRNLQIQDRIEEMDNISDRVKSDIRERANRFSDRLG